MNQDQIMTMHGSARVSPFSCLRIDWIILGPHHGNCMELHHGATKEQDKANGSKE